MSYTKDLDIRAVLRSKFTLTLASDKSPMRIATVIEESHTTLQHPSAEVRYIHSTKDSRNGRTIATVTFNVLASDCYTINTTVQRICEYIVDLLDADSLGVQSH